MKKLEFEFWEEWEESSTGDRIKMIQDVIVPNVIDYSVMGGDSLPDLLDDYFLGLLAYRIKVDKISKLTSKKGVEDE